MSSVFLISSRMQEQCLLCFCSICRTYMCFSISTVGSLNNVEYKHERIGCKKKYSVDSIVTKKRTDVIPKFFSNTFPLAVLNHFLFSKSTVSFHASFYFNKLFLWLEPWKSTIGYMQDSEKIFFLNFLFLLYTLSESPFD